MAILQTPSVYNFAGNFPDIIVATNNPVDFVLYQNDSVILTEQYTAQDSRIIIKLKSFFESELCADPLTAEDISSHPFQRFHYTINGELSETFFVMPGGVAGHVDAATFVRSNFLTWQPQTRRTTFHAPQWLRYASLQSCTLRVKAYFTDGADETKDIAAISAGNLYTFDVSYGKIRGKFAKQITYYDIWVAGTDRLTFVQRYVLAESYEICDDYFVFENTLGGFDTAKFSGESKEISEAESRTSIVNETTSEYDIDFKRSWRKCTGYIPDQAHKLWIDEFFTSRCRFRVGKSSLERIFVSKPKIESIPGEVSGHEFTYALAHTSKYLNLDRGKLPGNLEIVSPTGELFFLEPRLSQFPAIAGDNFLFPTQYPDSEKWHTISLAAMVALFMKYAVSSSEGQTYPAEKHAIHHAPEGMDSLEEFYAKINHTHTGNYHPYGGSLLIPLMASQLYAKALTVYGKSTLQDVDARNILAILGEFDKLDVKDTAVFHNSLSSPEFISGFLSGKGWAIVLREFLNAAGVTELKSYAEFDDLVVRGSLKVFELIINQLKGEADNYIFSGMQRIDHVDRAAKKIYLDTGGGLLYNPFRAGDILVCQQFGGMPSEQNDYNVIKLYEFVVTDAGCGSLDEGEKRLDWITFGNFVGSETTIAKGDIVVRVDSLTDPRRKGIMMNTTIGEFAPYQDVVYGLKTDPENAVKSRSGNLQGIHNPWFGWLKGFGLYTQNFYGIGEFHFRTGENVQTKIQMIENLFRVAMQKTVYNFTEEDNFLKNASFTENMAFWERASDIKIFTVNGRPLMLNGNLYSEKDAVASVVDYDGRNMLRIKKSGIRQRNADIRKPDPESTLYFSLKFICKSSGRLRCGFEQFSAAEEGALPLISETIAAGREFETRTISGTWDGKGDFVIEFTGDMYIEFLTLTNRPLDDFSIKVATEFKQTSELIAMLGGKVDNMAGTVSNLRIELNAMGERISIWGEKIDNQNSKIVQMGMDLNLTKEQMMLYVNKIDGLTGNITNLGFRMSAFDSALLLFADSLNAQDGSIISLRNRMSAAEGTIETTATKVNTFDGSITSLRTRMNAAEGKFGNYVLTESFQNYRDGVNITLNQHWSAIEQTDRNILLSINKGVGFPIHKDIRFSVGANGLTGYGGSSLTLKWLKIHYGDYVPTTTNYPASEWSAADRGQHVGDVFCNSLTGVYYTYSASYTWVSATPEFGTVPMDHPGILRIKKVVGTVMPGLGGFAWGNTPEANSVYETRFSAKIPVGYSINILENDLNVKIFWSGDRTGTGDWKEYKVQMSYGENGSFTATNYFYLTKTNFSGSYYNETVTWYLQSATVFNMSGYEDPISYINLAEEGVKIKGDKIQLEGAITANGNVEITPEGDLIVGRGGEFGGYIKTPLKLVVESDAQYLSGMGTGYPLYNLKHDLNILSCVKDGSFIYNETFYLPTTVEFEGAHICIHNANYPPYTRASLMFSNTVIRTGDGKGIRGFKIVGDETQWADPVGIRFMNGYVELFAVPAYKWNDSEGKMIKIGIEWTVKTMNVGIYSLIN